MSLIDRVPSLAMTAALTRRELTPATLPIRNVTPDDLDALADVFVSAYAGTSYDHGKSHDEVLAYLREITLGEKHGPLLWQCSFVALDAERPVATILTCEENGEALLQDVSTAPEYQRRGLATALLTQAMNALAATGYPFVRLRVAVANTTARRLYARLGFTEA